MDSNQQAASEHPSKTNGTNHCSSFVRPFPVRPKTQAPFNQVTIAELYDDIVDPADESAEGPGLLYIVEDPVQELAISPVSQENQPAELAQTASTDMETFKKLANGAVEDLTTLDMEVPADGVPPVDSGRISSQSVNHSLDHGLDQCADENELHVSNVKENCTHQSVSEENGTTAISYPDSPEINLAYNNGYAKLKSVERDSDVAGSCLDSPLETEISEVVVESVPADGGDIISDQDEAMPLVIMEPLEREVEMTTSVSPVESISVEPIRVEQSPDIPDNQRVPSPEVDDRSTPSSTLAVMDTASDPVETEKAATPVEVDAELEVLITLCEKDIPSPEILPPVKPVFPRFKAMETTLGVEYQMDEGQEDAPEAVHVVETPTHVLGSPPETLDSVAPAIPETSDPTIQSVKQDVLITEPMDISDVMPSDVTGKNDESTVPEPEMDADFQNILRATGLVFRTDDEDDQVMSEHFRGHISTTLDTSVCSNVDGVGTTTSAAMVGVNRKKLSKLLQREQAGIIEQLTNQRISCNCEEVQALGPDGNLDRFTLDITNAWRFRNRKNSVTLTPRGVERSGKITICQAILSMDGKTYRCCRTISRSLAGRLYRSSPAHPHVTLCDIHVANLRNHQCCPGCGLFCESGEFRACSKTQGHLYHDACQDKDRAGDFCCRHCLEASHHITVKIKNTGLTVLDVRPVIHPGGGLLEPRQPILEKDTTTNKYFRDFPLGFRICCAYVPQNVAGDLESVLQDLDLRTRVEMSLLDFLSVIVRGDLAGVLQFLLHPANLEQFYAAGTADARKLLAAPVQVAIAEKQPIALSVLLQAGFPLNIPDNHNLLPFELAAVSGNSVALLILKRFYDDLPSSAVREMSLRRLLTLQNLKSLGGIAMLFRTGFYNFHEFSLTDGEIYAALRSLLSGRDAVTLTQLALSPNIVEFLLRKRAGELIAEELLRETEHEFALDWLRRLGVRPPLPSTVSSLLSFERFRVQENGTAIPLSACTNPSQAHDRLVYRDLSSGRELHCVTVINNHDAEQPSLFKYVTQYVIETDKRQLAVGEEISKPAAPCLSSCSGTLGMPCGIHCECIKRGNTVNPGHGRPIYTPDGRLDLTLFRGQMLYECSPACSCGGRCGNILVQKPSKGTFQVFRLAESADHPSSWGLRTVYALPPGYFIGRLVGSIVLLEDVLGCIRPSASEIFILPCSKARTSPEVPDLKGYSQAVGQSVVVMTREYGNYTRFMARAASGNVMAVSVMSPGSPFSLPHIALFTKTMVGALEPLVLDVEAMVSVEPPLNLLHYDLAKKLCLP